MRVLSCCAVVPFAFWSGAALANPASPEGAEALIALFQTYLGRTAGVVSVAPEGDKYGVKLDFAPLAAKVPELTASISPIEFKLTDNGDGTWQVDQDQIFQLNMKVPDQLDLSLHIGHLTSTGLFDTALQSFRSNSGSVTDLSLTEQVIDPVMGDTKVSYQIASGQFESTGNAGETGGVDLVSTYALNGLAESFTLPSFAEGAPDTEITLRAETYTAEGQLLGLRPEALSKLLAFFVANPSEAAIIAQQAGLKAILAEGLPLFETFDTKGVITAVAAETPLGAVTLDEIGVEVEANGIIDHGLFSESFQLKGLALPSGMVPDWAAGLVPTDMEIGFTLTNFDLAAPAAILLSAVDFGAQIPEAQQAALLAALLPEGSATLILPLGGVTAPLYRLTYKGVLSFAPGLIPVGSADVTVDGMADVITALQSAPPEAAMQITPFLAMAQGLAKPADGAGLTWQIELTSEGGVLVNGTDLMGGGQ